jgi:hypothetical protein
MKMDLSELKEAILANTPAKVAVVVKKKRHPEIF